MVAQLLDLDTKLAVLLGQTAFFLEQRLARRRFVKAQLLERLEPISQRLVLGLEPGVRVLQHIELLQCEGHLRALLAERANLLLLMS